MNVNKIDFFTHLLFYPILVLSLLTLFFISSCSSFISVIETKQRPFRWRPNEIPTYCEKSFSLQSLMGSEKILQERFIQFQKNLKTHQITPTFIETAVLWSLVQFSARPDYSSPTAKFQTLIYYQGKAHYFEYSAVSQSSTITVPAPSAIQTYPYLYALEALLQKYPSHNKLETLSKWIDDYFDIKQLTVEEEFDQFLTSYSSWLKSDPVLSKSFYREDEVLKKNEVLPSFSYHQLIKSYLDFKKSLNSKNLKNIYLENDSLFTLKDGPWNFYCNFDISLYRDMIFLIAPEKVKSHDFGYHDQLGNSFIASSTQKLTEAKNTFGLPLIAGTSSTQGAAGCFIENNEIKDLLLILSSSNERDPAQHIYHLTRGTRAIQSLSELDDSVKKARYLFLNNPLRVVLESRRTSEEQLKELLKLNMPIYHSSSLGRFWSYLYKGPNEKGFVGDDRFSSYVNCY